MSRCVVRIQRSWALGACLALVGACSPATGNGEATRIRIGGPGAGAPKVDASEPLIDRDLTRLPLARAPRMPPVAMWGDLVPGSPPRAENKRALLELIKGTNSSAPERPDLLLRLAESYADDVRYHRSRHSELDQAVSTGGTTDAAAARRRGEIEKSIKRSLALATKIYKHLLSRPEHASFARMDVALIGFASTLHAAGHFDAAGKIYKKLVTDYPQSTHVPEAYLAFADHMFEQANYPAAEKLYDKVLFFPASRVYSYALYKKGWTLLRAGKVTEAVEAFTRVFKHLGESDHDAAVRREAVRSLALAFSKAGSPEKARAFFASVDGANAAEMLGHLARLYVEGGDAPRAMALFGALLVDAPARECEWRAGIAVSLLGAGDAGKSADATQGLIALLDGEASDACGDAVAGLALEWHRRAVADRDARSIDQALAVHAAALAVRAAGEERAETLLLIADLDWLRATVEVNPTRAAEQWRAAALRFDAAAAATTSSSRAAEARDAADKARRNQRLVSQRR